MRVIDRDVLFSALLGSVLEDAPNRAERIDSFTDQLGAYSDEEAYLVAWFLTRMVVDGLDGSCREAALHAVAEIVEWHPSALRVAQGVCGIDRSRLTISEKEYVRSICDQITSS